MKIKNNSVWLYTGPNPGKNIPHQVIAVTKEEVVTWSEVNNDPNAGGYSWLGKPADFIENFSPAELV